MLRLRNTLTREIEEVRPRERTRPDVLMRSDGLPSVARRQHALVPAPRPDRARAALPRRRRPPADEHHRRRTHDRRAVRRRPRQDAARRRGRGPDDGGDRREVHEPVLRRHRRASGSVRADLYPKATDHIPQIIELAAKLIERGHAYEKDGTVFYDVTTFPGYGRLSHQSLDDMRAAHRIEVDPTSATIRTSSCGCAAGPRRELVYESPWGPGYPGWHIECSAMSLHHLGDRFELHTGGVDNRFPHHEDEIAQSEGAVGHEVVEHVGARRAPADGQREDGEVGRQRRDDPRR